MENDCLVSVDGTDFRVEEPYPYERIWSKRWFVSKFKGAGLRYEVAVSIIRGDIVWINGPFAPGIYNDLKIFLECGLAGMLEANERVEADDGYFSADPEFAKARSGSWHPQASLDIRNTVRARHETVNTRLKFYGALRYTFKHGVLKHQEVFQAVAVLVQLQIENGNPLFSIKEYDDSKWHSGTNL